VGAFAVVRPQDDATARQVSDWCDALVAELVARGHVLVDEVDEATPAEAAEIERALRAGAELVLYFGHGSRDAWRTNGRPTIYSGNVGAAAGKAVVSIACLTGRELGPDAVAAGLVAWLGFTIAFPVLAPHKNADPFGATIVSACAGLASGATMGGLRDAIVAACAQLAVDFDHGGRFFGHPGQPVGYYGALALQSHVSIAGDAAHRPL
jgi:hypothetical protein